MKEELKLKNIILYFLSNQKRNTGYVSLARVAMVLYLIDWHSAIKHGKTITGINWLFNNRTIKDSDEIENSINDKTMFVLGKDDAIPCKIKTIIKGVATACINIFTEEEYEVFNRVIAISDERHLIELNIFVLSTYPVISGTDELNSDILGKALEYKQLKQNSKKQTKA